MNINVEIKVDSPELMTAILQLAEALPKLSLGSFSMVNGDCKVELISPADEGKDNALRGIGKVEVLPRSISEDEGFKTKAKEELNRIKALFKEVCHREETFEIFERYGAKKLSHLKVQDYKKIIKELEEFVCQVQGS